MAEEYDCIIVGAGPGGLQAAISLGRFSGKVLLLDRTGGRAATAKSIENFITHQAISGADIIDRGMEQARSVNVVVRRELVTKVTKQGFSRLKAVMACIVPGS